MVYPIVSLRELGLGARAYVEGLEDALIRTAGVYGVQARVRSGMLIDPVGVFCVSLICNHTADAFDGSADVWQCRQVHLQGYRASFTVQSQGRVKCRTGVWVGDRKLAAIGVRISRGIASHGVALNVSTDLSFYQHIVACGISNLNATSLERELRCSLDMQQVAEDFVVAFRNTFGYVRTLRVDAVRLRL